MPCKFVSQTVVHSKGLQQIEQTMREGEWGRMRESSSL